MVVKLCVCECERGERERKSFFCLFAVSVFSDPIFSFISGKTFFKN